MRKYLVLENDQAFVDATYKPLQRDAAAGANPFDLVYVTTVEGAREQLATSRFDGAILDLRLSNTDTAEGNEIAKQIHRDYFMPIAIVTGFEGELDEGIREMAQGGSAFVKSFNKNQMLDVVFQFLLRVGQSGVLQIMGPGGEMNQMLSDIFWKHLGPFMAQWETQTLSTLDRKRVLRHAVAHMLGALQSDEPGTWDKYLPGEVYIWPPICTNEMTGDIYVAPGGNASYLLVTPACDIASKTSPEAVRHFVQILPFSQFANEGKTQNLIGKKVHRYHVLPPSTVFQGGVVDFATISVIRADRVDEQMTRKGSIIEPYWREIVSRLGVWLSRQGTPEFEKEPLMTSIRQQWPARHAQ